MGDISAQPGEAGIGWLQGTPSPHWLLPAPFLQEALRPLRKENVFLPLHPIDTNPCCFSPVLAFASVLMVRCPWIQATTKLLNLPTRGGQGGRAGQTAMGGTNADKWAAGSFLSLMWWAGSPPGLCPGSPPSGDIVSPGPQLLTGPIHSPGSFPRSSGTHTVSFPGEILTNPSHKQPLGGGAKWGGLPGVP